MDKKGKENKKQQSAEEEKSCFECKQSLTSSPQLINVAGKSNCWHPECFKCSICREAMDKNASCHVYKEKLVCRDDYLRLKRDNSVKCARCRWPISASDWVRRAAAHVYHLACFNCDICLRQLNTGDQFIIRSCGRSSARLLCRLHFAVAVDKTPPTAAALDSLAEQSGAADEVATIARELTAAIGGRDERLVHRSLAASPSQTTLQRCDGQPQECSSSRARYQETNVYAADHKMPGGAFTGAPNQRGFFRANQASSPPQPSVGKLCAAARQHEDEILRPSTVHVGTKTCGPIEDGSQRNCAASSHSSSGGSLTSSIVGTCVQQKSKRVRTTFTEDQLSILQTHFQLDSNPDGQDLERIATITGLSKRVTQVWFQNSRARQKKYMIKRKPAGGGAMQLAITATGDMPQSMSASSSCVNLQNQRAIVAQSSIANECPEEVVYQTTGGDDDEQHRKWSRLSSGSSNVSLDGFNGAIDLDDEEDDEDDDVGEEEVEEGRRPSSDDDNMIESEESSSAGAWAHTN